MNGRDLISPRSQQRSRLRFSLAISRSSLGSGCPRAHLALTWDVALGDGHDMSQQKLVCCIALILQVHSTWRGKTSQNSETSAFTPPAWMKIAFLRKARILGTRLVFSTIFQIRKLRCEPVCACSNLERHSLCTSTTRSIIDRPCSARYGERVKWGVRLFRDCRQWAST